MLKAFLFLVFPALEIYLLIKVGSATGAMNMVLWIFASAIFGIWYARVHSQYSLLQMKADLEQGKIPQTALADSILISIAGVLLVLPGLITDTMGILLLFPPIRRLLFAHATGFFSKRQASSSTFFFTSGGFRPGGAPSGFPGRDETGFTGERPVFDVTSEAYQEATPPDYDDREPRQAVIIDSTSIEIQNSSEDAAGSEDTNAGKKQ